MSDPENFLSRWSRRKQEAERQDAAPEEAARDAPQASPPPAADAPVARTDGKAAADAELAFDPSTLPSIESIGIGTDIRSFLQKGVPAELTRAALRRAWTTDPAIRDFIEVAENQWDFATGKDLPGFGPLEAHDDVRRLVAEVFQGRRPETDNSAEKETAESAPERQDLLADDAKLDLSPQTIAAEPVGARTPDTEQASEEIVQRKDDIAMQQDAHSNRPIKRGHGGALPQ